MTILPLPPPGQRFRPVSAQYQPWPPRIANLSFGRRDSHAAPTAAAHRSAGCAPGSLRIPPAAPPLRPFGISLPGHQGTDRGAGVRRPGHVRTPGSGLGRPPGGPGPRGGSGLRRQLRRAGPLRTDPPNGRVGVRHHRPQTDRRDPGGARAAAHAARSAHRTGKEPRWPTRRKGASMTNETRTVKSSSWMRAR